LNVDLCTAINFQTHTTTAFNCTHSASRMILSKVATWQGAYVRFAAGVGQRNTRAFLFTTT